ncbi:MAG: hypothetical protein ACI9HI_001370 [Salinirussus sp.]|jgi:hypothetical protein
MTDGSGYERTVRTGGSETEESVAVEEAGGRSTPAGDDPVGTVRIPASATDAEADAIAAAVHAHLDASGRLPESEHDRETRQWVVGGRLLGHGAGSVPAGDEALADPWAAASRVCREW